MRTSYVHQACLIIPGVHRLNCGQRETLGCRKGCPSLLAADLCLEFFERAMPFRGFLFVDPSKFLVPRPPPTFLVLRNTKHIEAEPYRLIVFGTGIRTAGPVIKEASRLKSQNQQDNVGLPKVLERGIQGRGGTR